MRIWEIKNAFIKLSKMMEETEELEGADKTYLQDRIMEEWGKGEEALTDKLEAMSAMLKNYKHAADAFKAEKDKFARKQKTAENQIEFIKSRMILPTLHAAKLEKVDAGIHKVSIRHSKACEVQDMSALPEEFVKVEERKTADKREILKRLKDGEKINGAVLLENESILIK